MHLNGLLHSPGKFVFSASQWLCRIILHQNGSFGEQGSTFHGIALCSIIFNKYSSCALRGLIEHPHLIPMTSYILIISQVLLSAHKRQSPELGTGGQQNERAVV